MLGSISILMRAHVKAGIFCRPFGTRSSLDDYPRLKSLGYFRKSLRDKPKTDLRVSHHHAPTAQTALSNAPVISHAFRQLMNDRILDQAKFINRRGFLKTS